MNEPQFIRHPGIFVTATDTNTGKTVVSGAIAQILREQGIKVGVFKPIATGCRKERGLLISEDAEFLSKCCDGALDLADINPISYELPAAAILCAEVEKRPVDFEPACRAYEHICSKSDVVIVEGIGGIKVPITGNVDVLTLAQAFAMPIIIVARAGLGTINHTLLTIEAIHSAGLNLAGVVINGYDELNDNIVQRTNPGIIEQFGKTRVLAIVPKDEQTDIKQGMLGEAVLQAVSAVDWVAIAKNRK